MTMLPATHLGPVAGHVTALWTRVLPRRLTDSQTVPGIARGFSGEASLSSVGVAGSGTEANT